MVEAPLVSTMETIYLCPIGQATKTVNPKSPKPLNLFIGTIYLCPIGQATKTVNPKSKIV